MDVKEFNEVNSMCNCLTLPVPGTNLCIRPGNIVKLGRFETTRWLVSHGWYTWGGNRPFCGWYMKNIDNDNEIKPLQLNDLDDIYIIEI